MSKRIRLGMMGGGHTSFIGILHRIAAYMGERYEIVGGVFDPDFEASKDFALNQLDLDVSRVYENIDKFIEGENARAAEERIEAVVIVTPNFLHYEMAKKLIIGGFHVICEKPMTMNSEEAVELAELVERHQCTFALTHTYTGYPMVRQMKTMIAEGVIGKIQKIDAQYYQGWINPVIHDVEKRKAVWRLDPAKAGISSCMGDIGVHAFNMIEYTTGLQVQKLLSDMNTLYDNNPLDVDGTVLCRLDNEVRGIVRASQIATGEENNLSIAVYGDKGALKWEQESPIFLYHMGDGKPKQELKPGQPYNGDFSTQSTRMAPGHPEGIFDSMSNIYEGAAKSIRGEDFHDGSFPTVIDGVRGMKFIEATVKSAEQGNVWVDL